MKNLLVVMALVAGCKKKEEEKPVTPPPPPVGSDTGKGSGSAAATTPTPVAKAMSPEDLEKQWEKCWGFFSDGKLDDFKGCYAADAVLETPGAPNWKAANGPDEIIKGAGAFRGGFKDLKTDIQFGLVQRNTIVGTVLVHGTALNGKPVGAWFSHVVEFNDDGKVKHEWHFYDFLTIGAQTGMIPTDKMPPMRAALDKLPMDKIIVFAKNDDKERANQTTLNNLIAAENDHDAKKVEALLDDKLVWDEIADAKPMTKADFMKGQPDMWKSFSDLKFGVANVWAAGDYVAAVEAFKGTNDGDSMMGKKTGKMVDLPMLHIAKIEGGKVTASWITYQNLGFLTQLGIAPKIPGMGGTPADAGSGSAGSGSATK